VSSKLNNTILFLLKETKWPVHRLYLSAVLLQRAPVSWE